LFKLVNRSFELMAGFSPVLLQVFSLVGTAISLLTCQLVVFLSIRGLFVGPEVEGVSILFGLLFFLAGAMLFRIGLLGAHVGRLYGQSRERPRFLIRAHLRPAKDH
jgi:undecaprenyl-phosphate 4-deoxy-4-formamido-L-arabinose transferase